MANSKKKSLAVSRKANFLNNYSTNLFIKNFFVIFDQSKVPSNIFLSDKYAGIVEVFVLGISELKTQIPAHKA